MAVEEQLETEARDCAVSIGKLMSDCTLYAIILCYHTAGSTSGDGDSPKRQHYERSCIR